MATRTSKRYDVDVRLGVQVYEWTGLLNTDDGSPIRAAELSEKTWQALGTFGASGAITIEGSNDVDTPTNWAPISTRQGTVPMTLTATTQMNTSQDRPVWVRPRVTAGDGTTNLTVRVACHRFDLPGTEG